MPALTSISIRFLRDTAGVAAVEAAIIMPFLGVVGLGIMDCSYMFLQNHKMEQSLVAAANYMSLSADPESVEDEAKRIAVTGTIQTGGEPVIKNWSTSDITIGYKLIDNQDGDYRGGDFVRVVDITTSNSYDGFGLIKAVTGGSVTLSAQYQQRMTRALQ